MNKSTIIGVGAVIILVIIGGAWLWVGTAKPAPQAAPGDYKNVSYVIDGQSVALVNGRAERPAAPGSASMVVTQYFGNDATGDVNGDGVPDVAFILTQTTGGSGTFYYIVAALKTATGYQGTNGILLGDRIAPQTTQIEYGEVVVNYADRAANEPMTAAPSIGVSKYLQVTNNMLAEIPKSEYAAGNLLLGAGASVKLGTYLIGSNGMTLYAYAKDTVGVSNCVDTCSLNWLPYTVATTSALGNIQAPISGTAGVLTRPNGSLQVTYNSIPLYYYHLDTVSGDTKGQGFGGVWSVAKP